ncbi:MAG: ATP-binding protein [Epsilonproteobacteria bacterium]|nr:ATP-binding protein [Campylobacterota bacterium]
MKDYTNAKKLFEDTLDIPSYFDNTSAETVKRNIETAIEEKNVPLVFLIGDSGIGKSYILRYISENLKKKHLSIFIERPSFDKKEFLKILYEKKGAYFNPSESFNLLKERIVNLYKHSVHTVFIDEAQHLNEEQKEIVKIFSDTKVFQFILAVRKDSQEKILKSERFESIKKSIVRFDGIYAEEVYRYIQNTLKNNGFSEISSIFSKKDSKIITKYCDGNFRTIKKFIYSLLSLLEYADSNGLKKYSKINGCLLKMSALDIGVIDDK